jgi:hypothetical protein
VAIAACGEGEVDHGKLDEWRETQKGPSKLWTALGNSALSPDLRAHAAHNLMQLGEWTEVRRQLEATPEPPRGAIVAALVPRLEAAAQVPAGYAPSRMHTAAKDALFDLRAWSNPASRASIDGFLADWLGASFSDRVGRGVTSGVTIVKHVGAVAVRPLLVEARSIIAAPPDDQGRLPLFSDDLLKALAYSGDGEAAGLLVGLGRHSHPEPTLQRRAIAALYVAYVDDLESPRPPGSALKPHLDDLAAIITDRAQPGGSVNDAFALLAAAGLPECMAPFERLVARPGEAEAFLWVAVQKGLVCAGGEHAGAIVDAMPGDRPYQRGILEKYLWDKLVKLEPQGALIGACRELLKSPSAVARVTGVECLARIGSAGDAPAVAALASDRTRLRGWWGDQSELPARDRRPEPTLGSVAQEVADKL